MSSSSHTDLSDLPRAMRRQNSLAISRLYFGGRPVFLTGLAMIEAAMSEMTCGLSLSDGSSVSGAPVEFFTVASPFGLLAVHSCL